MWPVPSCKKMWFGCRQQPQLASSARRGRGSRGSWPGSPGTGWTDGPGFSAASHLSTFLKNMQINNNINPHGPSMGGCIPRVSAQVVQHFCTSLSIVKSSSLGTREVNKNEREWESIAQSRLYLLFNTSPSCGCQHRERYITYFPISLTVPSFLQQIKVLS